VKYDWGGMAEKEMEGGGACSAGGQAACSSGAHSPSTSGVLAAASGKATLGVRSSNTHEKCD
jgi:hypothetical protein